MIGPSFTLWLDFVVTFLFQLLFPWVFVDIMAADFILRAWAVFLLGIDLSEQLLEGLGAISDNTGGYRPGSDDWVSTLGDVYDSTRHDPQRQRSFSNSASTPSYYNALPSNPGGMTVLPSNSISFPQDHRLQPSAVKVMQPTNSFFFQNEDEIGQNPTKSVQMHEPDTFAMYEQPVSGEDRVIQPHSGSGQHSGAIKTNQQPPKGAIFQPRPQTNDWVPQSYHGSPDKKLDLMKISNVPHHVPQYGSKTSQEVKTASNDLHQKKKWSQQHVQSAQTPMRHGVHIPEPKKNPVWSPNEYYSRPDAQFGSEDSSRPISLYATAATVMLGSSSDYFGQQEQGSQQPVQSTQTHHGVQMPETSKSNHNLGSEDSRPVSPYAIATAMGTTSGYPSQYEPKHHTPAQNNSSYHFGTNGQHAGEGDFVPSGGDGSIGSTSGAESRQPSGEQILPSRVEALNLLKQALKDVSRGHPFHSVMQRLIPASSLSWNMGEREDFPRSVESSPSSPEVQSPFGEGSGSLSAPSVSQGETLYSGNSGITDENFVSGKPGSASEPQEPLPDGGVLSPSPSSMSPAFSNVGSAHKGYSNSARKETPNQQTTSTKAHEGLLQMASSAFMPHKVNTAVKVTPAQSRFQAYSFYNQKKSAKVVPKTRTNSFSVVQLLFPSKGSLRPEVTASKTSIKRYRITKQPIWLQAHYIVKSLNRYEMSKHMFSETSYIPLASPYTKTFSQVKLLKSRVRPFLSN